MVNMTLSTLRKTNNFIDIDDIVVIINENKKEEIGYFIPKTLKDEFEKFHLEMQNKRKKELLQKVLKASRKDPIEEGAISDGIK